MLALTILAIFIVLTTITAIYQQRKDPGDTANTSQP